jgi:hypothetical protein
LIKNNYIAGLLNTSDCLDRGLLLTMPLLKQKYLRLPEVFTGLHVARPLVFCVVFCSAFFVCPVCLLIIVLFVLLAIVLFVLLAIVMFVLLAIVLFVLLRFTASDCPFGILKRFGKSSIHDPLRTICVANDKYVRLSYS